MLFPLVRDKVGRREYLNFRTLYYSILNDLGLKGILATPPFNNCNSSLENEGCRLLLRIHLITNIIQFKLMFNLTLTKELLQVPKYK
jgi:hypothetical protein